MTVREAKKEMNIREWSEMVKAQQESGQSIRDWCAAQGISTSTFVTRQRKIKEYSLEMTQGSLSIGEDPNKKPSINIAKVSLPSSSGSTSNITIKYNGMEINMNNTVDPELAKYIIGAMLNA